MAIEIQAPTGDVIQFPDGTPDETIVAVMRREYGGPKQGPPAPQPKGLASEIGDYLLELPGRIVKGAAETIDTFTAPVTRGEPVFDPETGHVREGLIGPSADIAATLLKGPPVRVTTQGLRGIPAAEQKSWLFNTAPKGAAPAPAASSAAAKGLGLSDDEARSLMAEVEQGVPAPKPAPAAAPDVAPAIVPREKIVAASERLGRPVPELMATDSGAAQWAGGVARNVPGAGLSLRKSIDGAVTGLGEDAAAVATRMGGRTVEEAGELTSVGLKGWINETSQKVVDRVYATAERHIDDSKRFPLPNTTKVADDILARYRNANLSENDAAVIRLIKNAVTSPEGMNYSGAKFLRTKLIEKRKAASIEGISEGELKAVISSLTDDIKNIVQQAGTPRAHALWRRASRVNAQAKERRRQFAKIIGVNHDAAPAQVYDRLVQMAMDKSSQNSKVLLQARKALGQDWDGVGSAVVSRLGRHNTNGQDVFSLDKFVTDWTKLSPRGRALMFRNDHRLALDDIATIATGAKQRLGKFANPSGSGRQVLGGLMGGGIMVDPISTITSVLPATVVSYLLAKPATAKIVANYVKTASSGNPKVVDAATKQFLARITAYAAANDNTLKGLMAGARSSAASEQDEQR